ncbi:MAG TPA: ATP-binding protein [Phycisphaerales bacterium]|nr:ATP-binding protein [Phycisphaerales bacterium]
MEGDVEKIKQVVINLLGNACKFTEKGEVRLELRIREQTREDIAVVFTVVDTGPGVPSEKIEEVFQPFAQLSETRSREDSTGLGLAICRGLVEGMGGRLWMESEVGIGTNVSFEVRLKSPRQTSVEKVPDKSVQTVILTEDDSDYETLRSLLARWHIDRIARELKGRSSPDLLFLDGALSDHVISEAIDSINPLHTGVVWIPAGNKAVKLPPLPKLFEETDSLDKLEARSSAPSEYRR